jgi:hypothetical protein
MQGKTLFSDTLALLFGCDYGIPCRHKKLAAAFEFGLAAANFCC